MGRRNRSKRNLWDDGDDDDGDGLERAEAEWLMHRRSRLMEKRRRTEAEDKEVSTAKSENDKNEVESSVSEQNTPNNYAGPQTTSPKNANSSEEDKIERLKLKKRRQKEKRKEKKARATSAAKAIEQCRQESQKSLQNKQNREQEKKKRIKEVVQSQQFITLEKGVKYQDLIVGKGPPVQHRKKVRVSYTLRSKSHTTGKILDSSANFGFRLGKGEVIKGWDIGLRDMRVGGVRRLVVPPSAGYGHGKDVGAGRGSDLYFQIDLLHVAP